MKRIAMFFGAFVALSLFAGNALACVCGQADVTDQFFSASAVFSGVVVSKRKSDVLENGVEVKLHVNRVWKGEVTKDVSVFSGATLDLYPFFNDCAPDFKTGGKYIVLAGAVKDHLLTNICSGSQRYQKQLAARLGKGKRPQKKAILKRGAAAQPTKQIAQETSKTRRRGL
jgi:hypothetical protein